MEPGRTGDGGGSPELTEHRRGDEPRTDEEEQPMAATTDKVMRCTPEDVWNVLADGWLYGLWVVGASRIRGVDRSWPSPDSRIHHSVGSWPHAYR